MHGLIDTPNDWRGPEMARSRDWIHEFTAAEIAEIEHARDHAQARGKSLATLEIEDFPLPRVAPLLHQARERLEFGPGLHLFRGFPADRYGKADLRLVYWGLGKHLGTAVSQSSVGDLLGDVRNIGSDVNSPTGRGYRSNQRLSYHTDSCDVTGLFVLRTAKTGGLSMLASSVAIHNELMRRRPDLAEALYEPVPWSWNGQEAPGEKPWYMQPVYAVAGGRFACRFIRGQINNAQRFADAPRLTAAQDEGMAMIEALANSEQFHFSMMFVPGDLQLVNNHVMYHARTAFEDHPEPDRHRHLLRMWLSVANSRPLDQGFSTIYRDRHAGAVRGGFPSRTGKHQFETIVTTD
jgi:hypothetical protein